MQRSHIFSIRAGSVSDGVFLLMTLLIAATSATAEDRPTETVTKKTERYLGVVTEPVSDAMAAQLKGVLSDGRGVLVKRVLPDSPAAKAGLEPFDIVFQAEDKSVATSDQLKDAVAAQPAGQALKLQFIRGAKVQTIDVMPGERVVSRLIVRHTEANDKPDGEGEASAKRKRDGEHTSNESYAVNVQTKNGKDFRVEVRLGDDEAKSAHHKFTGDAADIAQEMKSLPEPVRKSVSRQLARLQDDRTSPKSVQFRFRPQREGNRQMLVVTLRKPDAAGAIHSFELQQPLADATASVSLEKLLDNPDFAAHLKDLDPAVRARIEATLKTASLPASTIKVEDSQ